jgi:hypothetical protein
VKPKLKLIVNKDTRTSTRRYETDYAGAWRGHCKTRESAIAAAHRHLANDGYSRATVTDKHTGDVIARLRMSDDRKRIITEVIKPFRKVGL